jgi:Domain of unknown function (DUF4352)
MPKPHLPLALCIAIATSACDNKPPESGSTQVSLTVPATGSTAISSSAVPAAASTSGVPDVKSVTVGHIRVTIKKVSVGKVPLKAADGTTAYSDEPRLMIALRIENLSDKKQSKYSTWVPDLDMAKTVAKLTDDHGMELKRVTLGFGNNVKDRTVTDDLTPGKVITDLLLFEVPTRTSALRLELPGANVGVKDSFVFQIEEGSVKR